MAGELGVHVCGGRGKHSRKTPVELVAIGERVEFEDRSRQRQPIGGEGRQRRPSDGFDLYLHGFIVTNDGHWVIVQQGMNEVAKTARRYHWLSEGLKSFVEEPHSGIDGVNQGEIVNLTDRRGGLSSRPA